MSKNNKILQLRRIMKLTTFMMIVGLMQASAAGFAQKVSLNVKNVPLARVLQAVKQQTQYQFVYTEDLIARAKPVNIQVRNAELKEVLAVVFEGQPLSFSIESNTIVVKEKEPSLLDQAKSALDRVISNTLVIQSVAKDLNVKGRVVDQDGKPLPNASIRVKGKSAVTNTNAEGEFEIKGVDEDAVLLVSYVGFKTLEIGLKDAVMPLEIKLNVATGELEEVKVVYNTGYQDIPKERATGSFVQLNNEDISRTISTNILDRILNTTNSLKIDSKLSNGPVANNSNITIRGISTINANRKPLIVIDGFPYEEDSQSPTIILNNINPNDVENVTVLRDAAAASIWGARAGNGVIVITTKKGKFNQKSSVQINSSLNIAVRPNLFKARIMSSADVINYEKKLFANGIYDSYNGPFPSNYTYPEVSPATEIMLAQKRGAIAPIEAEKQLAELSNHDVRNDINKYLLQTSVNQQYNLNVKGGGDKMNYYGSIGYDKNLTSTVGNEFDRLTLNLNNTYRPMKNLEFNAYVVYIQSKNQDNGIPYTQFLSNGNLLIPSYTMLADANGNPLHIAGKRLRAAYIDTLKTKGLLDWHYRPLEEIRNSDNKINLTNTRFGGGLKFTIIEGLSINVNGQYEKSLTNTDRYQSVKIYSTKDYINRFMFLNAGVPQYPVPNGGILNYSNQIQNNYNLRGLINFNKTWDLHALSAIVGVDLRESRFDFNESRKYGYDPLTLGYVANVDYKDLYITRPSGNASIVNSGTLQGTLNRFLSYYSNIGYTLLNRYTFTVSGRIDASNFFGVKANLKFVPLWSVGTGWDISKESFFNSSVINAFKFRATYGFSGNMDNSATALPTIQYLPGNSLYTNSQQYAQRSTPPNPGLTWEKIGMLNVGIDISLFNDRLNGSLEYYRRKSNNLIGNTEVDPTVGFTSYTANYASTKGKGIDFMIAALIINHEIKFRTNLSFSYNTNKVTNIFLPAFSLTNPASYLGGIPVVGKALNYLYSYKWGGLNPLTGEPMGSVNGQTVPATVVLGSVNSIPNTKLNDLVYHGFSSPPIFGNMLNTLSYKGLSGSFNILYSFGYYFRRASVSYTNLQTNLGTHADYALRWKKPGDELRTNIPSIPASASSQDNFYSKSEILVEKGDHIRLQDIRLSYDLNMVNFKKKPFNNASVFIYVNNLGIIWKSNNKGIDPNFDGVPTPRSMALGLTINY